MSIINWQEYADINTDDIKPKSFVLPVDWYRGELTKANIVLTKAGQEAEISMDKAFSTVNPNSLKGSVYGAMLQIEFTIKSGKDTGTAQQGKTFKTQMWFCLKKDNPGLNNIKKIASAVGLSELPENTANLCEEDFWMKIKLTPPQGQYGEKNEFDGAMSEEDMIAWAEKKGFTVDKSGALPSDSSGKAEDFDDDIPF